MKLKIFLYLLLRDGVVPGEVERMVREAEKDQEALYNKYLADYAEDLAKRLQ